MADTHWSCSACTFANNADAIQCEICQTAKPALAPGSAAPSAGWNCDKCTFKNEGVAAKCLMCSSAKPTPPAASVPATVSAVVAPPKPTEWTCSSCTFQNSLSATRCAMCNHTSDFKDNKKDADKDWIAVTRDTLLSKDIRFVQQYEKPQVEEAVNWVPRGSDNNRIRRLIESYIPRVRLVTLVSEQGLRIPIRVSYAEVSGRVKHSMNGRWYEDMEIRLAITSTSLKVIVQYMNHYQGTSPPVPENFKQSPVSSPTVKTWSPTMLGYTFKTIPASSSSLISPTFSSTVSSSSLTSTLSTSSLNSSSGTPPNGKRKSASPEEMTDVPNNKKEKLSTDKDGDTEITDATSTLSVEDRIPDDFAMALVSTLQKKEQGELLISAGHLTIPHLEYICRMVAVAMKE